MPLISASSLDNLAPPPLSSSSTFSSAILVSFFDIHLAHLSFFSRRRCLPCLLLLWCLILCLFPFLFIILVLFLALPAAICLCLGGRFLFRSSSLAFDR